MNISGIELTSRQAYDIYQHVRLQKIRDEAEHQIAFAIDELVEEGVAGSDYTPSEADIQHVCDSFLSYQNKNVAENETWKVVMKWWKEGVRGNYLRYHGMVDDNFFDS